MNCLSPILLLCTVVLLTCQQETNKQATRESMVLLQNDDARGLPFAAGSHIAVIGPHGQAQAVSC